MDHEQSTMDRANEAKCLFSLSSSHLPKTPQMGQILVSPSSVHAGALIGWILYRFLLATTVPVSSGVQGSGHVCPGSSLTSGPYNLSAPSSTMFQSLVGEGVHTFGVFLLCQI